MRDMMTATTTLASRSRHFPETETREEENQNLGESASNVPDSKFDTAAVVVRMPTRNLKIDRVNSV